MSGPSILSSHPGDVSGLSHRLDTTPNPLTGLRGLDLKVIGLAPQTGDDDEGRPNDIIVGSLD